MEKPLVCFISYNRLGMSAANLEALLKTEDDFDLVIVDNASTDGIWEYIETIKDDRIKLKHRFNKNYGVIYAVNYGLSKRKRYQPFIAIENDMFIRDKDWVKKFQQTAKAFPELGMIGAVAKNYLDRRLTSYSQEKIDELISNKPSNKMQMIFIPEVKDDIKIYYRPDIIGGCLYLTPQVLDIIGYWNEETCGGDAEIGKRINLFTPYYTAVTTAFFVEYRGISCKQCSVKEFCKLANLNEKNCLLEYKKVKSHSEYVKNLKPKIDKLIYNIKEGNRSVYSASIHDSESIINNFYDLDSAINNFEFFMNYSKNK
jgi:glycosyltransferase involved in cell wall biosynthesis